MVTATGLFAQRTGRRWLGIDRRHSYWYLVALLGAYLAAIIATNLYLMYPSDGDFQFVGWMAQHQTPSRLESYANTVYPPGFPFLLAHLVPYFKTILHAVFFVQAVAMTTAMWAVFAISQSLFGSFRYATLSMLLAMILSIPVATSEFADGTTTALVLLGLWLLVRDEYSMPSVFMSGVLCGIAYVFRFHYVVFLGIVPIALVLTSRLQKRLLFATLGAYIIGFLGGASPMLVINSIVHANPFWSGDARYMPGMWALGLDWNNYPNTYNLWPIKKLLFERPQALLLQMARNTWRLLQFYQFWLGIPLIFMLLRKSSGALADRLRFVVIAAVTYVFVTVVPTRITDRGLLPVTALLSILIVPAIALIANSLDDKLLRIAFLSSICGLVLFQPPHVPRWKTSALATNRQILQALEAAGMSQSSQVFCNDWWLYNLDDAYLTPFYNYGAYMLLDSEYERQRPLPTAKTGQEWVSFFANRGIRYIVIGRGTDLDYLAEHEHGNSWKILTETGAYRVFQIEK